MGDFSFLINSVQNITGPMVVMWLIGGLLIWLAIKKDYEPALLLPMGFGAIPGKPAGYRRAGGQRHYPMALQRGDRRL